MPIFEFNNKKYNVLDKDIDALISKHPDAVTIATDKNGKRWKVKASNYYSFVSANYPDQQTEPTTAAATQSGQTDSNNNQTGEVNKQRLFTYDNLHELVKSLAGGKDYGNIRESYNKPTSVAETMGYTDKTVKQPSEPKRSATPTAGAKGTSRLANILNATKGDRAYKPISIDLQYDNQEDGKAKFFPKYQLDDKGQKVYTDNITGETYTESDPRIKSYVSANSGVLSKRRNDERIETSMLQEADNYISEIKNRDGKSIYDARFEQAKKDAQNYAMSEYSKIENNANFSTDKPEEIGFRLFTASKASHLKAYDLQKMADDTWDAIPIGERTNMAEGIVSKLKSEYPNIDDKWAYQYADQTLRMANAKKIYNMAKKMNAPKNELDLFFRSFVNSNVIGSLAQGAARSQAGTVGDMAAREEAEQEYINKGHKTANIIGTVAGFATDPSMMIGGGLGKLTVGGGMALAGKAIGGAATRKAATTLTGRLTQRAVAGGVNFATFEGIGEAANQYKWGGYRDPNTGNIGDYNASAVLGSVGHGFIMGGVTGVAGELIGNVFSKAVKSTKSTVGKVGVRTAELGTAALAEGSIFAVPQIYETKKQYDEYISSLSDSKSKNYIADEAERKEVIAELERERKGSMMDVWTDNMAMIAGFKAQGLAMSARKRIAQLRRQPNSRVGFETRLRRVLDGQNSMALTKGEKAELKAAGYNDLNELVDEYKELPNDKKFGVEETNRFAQFVEDTTVSERARAKMYYYVTGHTLPLHTILSYSVEKKESDDGKTSYTIKTFGNGNTISVDTYRTKSAAEAAEVEVKRQIEFNTVDFLEKIYDAKYGEESDDKTPSEKLREEINSTTNVNIDATIKKEDNRRTEAERKALNDYIVKLGEIDVADDRSLDNSQPADPKQHTDGNYHIAKLKRRDNGEEQEVYVTYGNIVTREDGTIDAEKSDESITVYNPSTGKKEIISPTKSAYDFEVGETLTSEEYNARRKEQEAAEEEVVEPTEEDVNETNNVTSADMPNVIEPGMEFIIKDENGEDKRVLVTSRGREDDNGEFVVGDDGDMIEYSDGSIAERVPETEFRTKSRFVNREKTVNENEPDIETATEETKDIAVENVSDEMPMIGDGEPDYKSATPQRTARYLYDETDISEAVADGIVKANYDKADKNLEKTEKKLADLDKNPGTSIAKYKAERTKLENELKDAKEELEYWSSVSEEHRIVTEQKIANAHDWGQYEGKEYVYKGWNVRFDKVERDEEGNAVVVRVTATNDKGETVYDKFYPYDFIKLMEQGEFKTPELSAEQKRLQQEEMKQSLDKANAEVNAEIEKQRRIAEEQRKQREENANKVGTEIRDKWNNAAKIEGRSDEIVLPNGERVSGRFILHESGDVTASHNSTTWDKSKGFPEDENGNTVNDRDYKADDDARKETERIAEKFDQRALQSPVIVSRDGVVLSGNGRTIAGEIAARNGTDADYLDYLARFADKFGFTEEQVRSLKNPRVSFLIDKDMPYNAETFAKFNQQEMKSQSKTEQSVKLGKTVRDDTFRRVVDRMRGFDTLAEFYNNPEAALGAIMDLHKDGVISRVQLAEMVDGVEGSEKLSDIGRNMLETMLVGKVFDNNPEVVRILAEMPQMRKKIVGAMSEIADNIALGDKWSLQSQLAEAVEFVYKTVKGSKIKEGESVSIYAGQLKLFTKDGELPTMGDIHNKAMLLLADAINDSRVTLLRKVFALYNSDARDSAAGQIDLFDGRVRTVEDILNDVINYINNGKKKEIEQREADAVAKRKGAGSETSLPVEEGDGKSGQGGDVNIDSGEFTPTQGEVRQQKGSGIGDVSSREAALRDTVVDDILRKSGMEVFEDVETGQRLIDAENGEKRLQKVKSSYDPRDAIKPVRGEWTKSKIIRRLKDLVGTRTGYSFAARRIAEFDSAEELAEHMFYHGTQFGGGRLKPSILMSDSEIGRIGGGGYGEKYWGISVSRSKRVASNFSTGRSIRIYPIILVKNAKVKEMPELKDAVELEDYIEDLWKEGVDAVWIGDKNAGEQELCVLNPAAIVNIDRADFYDYFKLGTSENPLHIIDANGIEKLYQDAKRYVNALENKPQKPEKPSRFLPAKNGETIGEMKSDEQYQQEMSEYEQKLDEYNNSDEVRRFEQEDDYARRNIRFFRTPDGHAYGFVKDGKIFIDPRIATAETPIHEYAHLWAEAMRHSNPKEWENIVRLMRGTGIWDEVVKRYPELKSDSEIADEVLSHYSGRRGAERLREEMRKVSEGNGSVSEKAAALSALERVKIALKRFWKGVADWFGIHFTTAEEVADKVLSDLLNGVNPNDFIGKRKASDKARMQEDAEMADIVARAKADGTYMKAPNGKPSKLSERQWVQVRTKAFKNWFGDWENDPENCSKVVDENGEPRVVYHQTNSTIFVNRETGESFDNLNWKEKDYWRNEASEEEWNDTWEERDFYAFDNKNHGRRSVEMPAFFFSPVYDEYHEYGDRTVAAFLNIRNPIVNPDIPNRGVSDNAGEDAMNALIAQGYDGFIRKYDGVVEEVNAFFPNQIKSATENIGTFDQNNSDIRYQFVGERGAAAMDKAEEASVRLDNLAVAREMEAAGKDAKAVKLATGWERRRSLASETEDVAREDQIFLEDGLGMSSSERVDASENVSEKSLEEVNERFNEELGRLTEENKDKVVLSLGRPSDILLAAGVSDKPMKLYGNKAIKKMRKHGFALAELKDLPRAVADPIAVFDNIGREGNRSILTELRTEQGNFLVTVDLGKDADVDFNIVSSVFGKGSSNVIDWINKGLATYINKEKALAFLSHPSAPIAAAAANAELVSAAKVVENFKNPEVLSGKSDKAEDKRKAVDILGERYGVKIRVVENSNEITDADENIQKKKRGSKGWYEKGTGEVVVVLNNNESVEDVVATVSHEIIAHKGLREMIGEERYNDFLDEVYNHLREDLKKDVDTITGRRFVSDTLNNKEKSKSYEQHRRDAVDELFGRLAEKPFEEFSEGERTLWQKLKKAVRKIIDKFLGDIKLPKWFELGDNEIRYILWRSKERLERGVNSKERDEAKRKELGLNGESDVLFRDVNTDMETEDIWKDKTLGLRERMTAAAVRLSENHKDSKEAKTNAMRAIGGNLSDLRKAMSAQKEYDKTTVKRVVDLAKVLIKSKHLNSLSDKEVRKLLSVVSGSVGKQDIKNSVDAIMDIMVDNQLKNAESTLYKLLHTKAKKINDKGVVAMSQLDLKGQTFLNTLKEYMAEDEKHINEAISNAVDDLTSDNETIRHNAEIKYDALQLALQYKKFIAERIREGKDLKEELSRAKEETPKEDKLTQSFKEYKQSIEDAIKENKVARITAYADFVSKLSSVLSESKDNARAIRRADRERVSEIHKMVIKDLGDKKHDIHTKEPTTTMRFIHGFANAVTAPFNTFEQFFLIFGGKYTDGKGYLYDYFVRGVIDARNNELLGLKEKHKQLDDKAKELFGGKNWQSLLDKYSCKAKVSIDVVDGNKIRTLRLTQGNVLYIYMVNKMSDGKMKLRKMGISEEDVARLAREIDPRLIDLGDWLQEEFLPNSRDKYNATHERLFGAPMTAIENYFPIKINKNAIATKEEDLDNPERNNGIATTTGAIKERTKNSLPFDILNSDALDVVLGHIKEMEHFSAFGEINRDINTLRTYKRFENIVKNMHTFLGTGDNLLNNFNRVCQIAVGSYRPRGDNEVGKAMVNIAKGVTGAKISFRVYTALKQFASYPAYIFSASPEELAKATFYARESFVWCMDNLPIIEERWKSKVAGDPRLAKTDTDWSLWNTKLARIASKYGMGANAFVDVVTVTMGAKAIYETNYKNYVKKGYGRAEAERRAKQDATIFVNSTQQSSEGVFLSPLQVDRTWNAVMFSVFRNASYGYGRNGLAAARNLNNYMTHNRSTIINSTAKLYMSQGIEEEQAYENARGDYRKVISKNIANFLLFNCILTGTWVAMGYAPYLMNGNNEEEKKKIWKEIGSHTALGFLEGVTGGDVLGSAMAMVWTGEFNAKYLEKNMPITSDIATILNQFANGKNIEAMSNITNLLVSSATGVDPRTFGNMVNAFVEACGNDPKLANETAIFVGQLLNIPKSQLSKMYFDELNLSGNEISNYTPQQLAERYAKYKVREGYTLMPWEWDNEELLSKYEKYTKKKITESLNSSGDKEINEQYSELDEKRKAYNSEKRKIYEMAEEDIDKANEMYANLMQKYKDDIVTIDILSASNKEINKIVKGYFKANTPSAAILCKETLVETKKQVINLINAKTAEERKRLSEELTQLIKDFYAKYEEYNK